MRHPVLRYCDNEALFTQDIKEKLLIAQLRGAKFFNHQDVDIYELFDDRSLLFHIRLQRDCYVFFVILPAAVQTKIGFLSAFRNRKQTLTEADIVG